jgi:hypothetical protein
LGSSANRFFFGVSADGFFGVSEDGVTAVFAVCASAAGAVSGDETFATSWVTATGVVCVAATAGV